MTKRVRAAWAIALVMRVAYNKDGDCNGGKSNGDEGARQATATWVMAMTKATTWVMVMATRLVDDE